MCGATFAVDVAVATESESSECNTTRWLLLAQLSPLVEEVKEERAGVAVAEVGDGEAEEDNEVAEEATVEEADEEDGIAKEADAAVVVCC